MINYSVKPAEQEGAEQIIVKVGQSHEFVMSAVKSDFARLAQMKTALVAQKELESAKMTNVKEHHEVIGRLTDEELCAVQVYMQAKNIFDQCEAKLAEIDKADADLKEEVAAIKEQTGVELPE